MSRIIKIICFVLTVVILAPSALQAKETARVKFHNGKLSVTFENTPLIQALQKIAASTGTDFFVDHQLQGEINTHFKDLPLDEAVNRIFSHYDYAAFFGKSQAGGYRLTKVKVFRKGKQVTAKYDKIPGASYTTGKAPGYFNSAAASGAVAASSRLIAGRGINPVPSDPRGRILGEIVSTEHSIMVLQHKDEAERQILHSKISRIQQVLSAPENDKPENLDQLKTFEGQLARQKEVNALMMMNAQGNLLQLQKELAKIQAPRQKRTTIISRKKPTLLETGNHITRF